MSDKPTSPNELAFMLGRIQGDVKHILEALTRNQEKFSEIENRLDRVERSTTKILAVAYVLGPLLMVALNVGLKYIGL